MPEFILLPCGRRQSTSKPISITQCVDRAFHDIVDTEIVFLADFVDNEDELEKLLTKITSQIISSRKEHIEATRTLRRQRDKESQEDYDKIHRQMCLAGSCLCLAGCFYYVCCCSVWVKLFGPGKKEPPDKAAIKSDEMLPLKCVGSCIQYKARILPVRHTIFGLKFKLYGPNYC